MTYFNSNNVVFSKFMRHQPGKLYYSQTVNRNILSIFLSIYMEVEIIHPRVKVLLVFS